MVSGITRQVMRKRSNKELNVEKLKTRSQVQETPVASLTFSQLKRGVIRLSIPTYTLRIKMPRAFGTS